MATEFDNRIQFPPTLIDFDDSVGTTGQAHDDYPAPGQPPRFDWMRSVLIGLLSNQSSNLPPSQFRTGTLWYDRTTNSIMIFDGTHWVSLSDHILLKTSPTDPGMTLTDFFKFAVPKLDQFLPKMTYSGIVVGSSVLRIPVPETLQPIITPIKSLLQPLVYLNGKLVDPRLCTFSSSVPIFIQLDSKVIVNDSDTFTVVIERFDQFLLENVIAS